LEAATEGVSNPGDWADNLHAIVDTNVADDAPANTFNLTLQLLDRPDAATGKVLAAETFRNVSTEEASPRYVQEVLAQQSQFARATAVPGAPIPGNALFTGGDNGDVLQAANFGTPADQQLKVGLYALEDADLFNLLNIPPFKLASDTSVGPVDMDVNVLSNALTYCQERRAMLIVDPPSSWNNTGDAETNIDGLRGTLGGTALGINGMIYFPQLCVANPLRDNRLEPVAPGGAMAGLIARTDAQRGVWKAPAGIDASLVGVREFSYPLTDGENGRLNPRGINCLRTITPYGNISWGARTLAGDDRMASEWKYVPVRRTALYIEESLFRGLHWVVFEPNDETLWGQIRLNVGSFMHNLFRQGAFQGTTPRDAYLVKCDAETNPQSQIDQGIVTVLVGFAPLKPAEFVIIQIQQLAGQLEV
jgi:phage tail sheath protein FI